MKILFLAHRAPCPPDTGDKIRSYNLLNQLAQRHEVTLVSLVDGAERWEHVGPLERICRRTELFTLNPAQARLSGLGSLLQGRSFSEGYFFSTSVQRLVNQFMRRQMFDVVYVFSPAMARYVQAYAAAPIVVDFVHAGSRKWSQLAQFRGFPTSRLFRLESRRLAAFELSVSSWARRSLFVSEAEASLFRSIGGQGSVTALPSGVDGDLLRLPTREQSNQLAIGGRTAKLIFAGTIKDFPNADAVRYFAREVFPLIRRQHPFVTFDIVGPLPPRSVRKLHGKSGIRVLGVSDIRTHLVQADISVAPLRIAHEGQNAILEAMALSLPVVATPEAVEGIHAQAEEEVLIGANPETFASQVLRLLQDHQLRRQLARRARARVLQSYKWKNIGTQLEQILAQAIQEGGPQAQVRGARRI